MTFIFIIGLVHRITRLTAATTSSQHYGPAAVILDEVVQPVRRFHYQLLVHRLTTRKFLIRGSFMKRKVDRVTANHYLRLGIAFTVTFPLAIPNLSCHIRSAATTLDSWRCEYNSMVGRFPFATTLKVLHGCYWRTCSSKIFI